MMGELLRKGKVKEKAKSLWEEKVSSLAKGQGLLGPLFQFFGFFISTFFNFFLSHFAH